MSDIFTNAIAAVQSAYDADLQAADTAGYQRGYSEGQAVPSAPAGDGSAPAPTPVPPVDQPAMNVYTQEQYDAAVAAQKQADQALIDAMTKKAEYFQAKVALLQEDINELAGDLAKIQLDSTVEAPSESEAPVQP